MATSLSLLNNPAFVQASQALGSQYTNPTDWGATGAGTQAHNALLSQYGYQSPNTSPDYSKMSSAQLAQVAAASRAAYANQLAVMDPNFAAKFNSPGGYGNPTYNPTTAPASTGPAAPATPFGMVGGAIPMPRQQMTMFGPQAGQGQFPQQMVQQLLSQMFSGNGGQQQGGGPGMAAPVFRQMPQVALQQMPSWGSNQMPSPYLGSDQMVQRQAYQQGGPQSALVNSIFGNMPQFNPPSNAWKTANQPAAPNGTLTPAPGALGPIGPNGAPINGGGGSGWDPSMITSIPYSGY